jgi:hypothetical protein
MSFPSFLVDCCISHGESEWVLMSGRIVVQPASLMKRIDKLSFEPAEPCKTVSPNQGFTGRATLA